MALIGRKKESTVLRKVIASNRAEFVAVYGRRRIGKTYLIQQCTSEKGIYLEYTGLKDGSLKVQLSNFYESFSEVFYPGVSISPSKTWKEAFTLLTNEILKIPKTKKFILFLDELPWIASPKSGFLQNLDYFWNTRWSKLSNFKLIVCGSAASWILNNSINAKGGLHNRITKTILLEPFNLLETRDFLESKKIKLPEKQILDLYMTIGGVPYYLEQLDPSESLHQNINRLCFTKDGLLFSEFQRLFRSLFNSSELYTLIVKEIAKKHYGISFKDLVFNTGKKVVVRFKRRLEELEACGFIEKFLPYGKKKRDHYYKVIDEYSLFYLKWIADIEESGNLPRGLDYWSKISKTPSWASWCGYSFENVCYKHIDQILKALNLTKVSCLASHWQYKTDHTHKEMAGAQVDLVLDRDDGAVTLCEIKYSSEVFVIDKVYAKNLINKLEAFENCLEKPKQILLTIITTIGLKKNPWEEELVNNTVLLKDFFHPL